MQFFNISTSKSGLRPSVFYVLRATTVCTFSASQLQKVLRSWGVFRILTWKCASRHNGVHIVISHLARWLRTRRFSEPTFRPSGDTNHWKTHSVSRLFYLFAHLHPLSSDSFSSLIFFLILFSSLTLPTSAFPSVHIVGSLTSKLPSIIYYLKFRIVFCCHCLFNNEIKGWDMTESASHAQTSCASRLSPQWRRSPSLLLHQTPW